MCKLFLNKKAFVFTAFALFSLVFIQLNSADANPKVLMETSKGDITIELYEKEAPITVKNFLSYVSDGFYNNLIFHRVIPNFMIQGGGFDSEMNQKPVNPLRD
jgi:hypothetical protein